MTYLLAWHKASPLDVFNPNVEEKNLKEKKGFSIICGKKYEICIQVAIYEAVKPNCGRLVI